MFLPHARCKDDDRFLTDYEYAIERCNACPHFFNGECKDQAVALGLWDTVPGVLAGVRQRKKGRVA